MLRYGILGLLLFYLPHLLLLFTNKRFLFQLVFIVLIISNLDPPYNEPKIQTLYWILVIYLMVFEKKIVLNKKMSND